MDNVIVILSYVFGAIATVLFVIACILCAKTLKIYGGGKNNALAFPVALAAVSTLNISLFSLLIIETLAIAALALYFYSQYKAAKALVSASTVSESEPEPVAVPATVEEVAKVEVEAGTVIEHKASEEEVQIVADRLVEAISAEEAHNAVSDEIAAHFVDKKKSEVTRYQKKSIVNIDTLAENFESGDSVNLEVLIQKGLIPKGSDYVKVLARGNLNKKLIVEANDYSADAVKMIILTGGSVTEII